MWLCGCVDFNATLVEHIRSIYIYIPSYVVINYGTNLLFINKTAFKENPENIILQFSIFDLHLSFNRIVGEGSYSIQMTVSGPR